MKERSLFEQFSDRTKIGEGPCVPSFNGSNKDLWLRVKSYKPIHNETGATDEFMPVGPSPARNGEDSKWRERPETAPDSVASLSGSRPARFSGIPEQSCQPCWYTPVAKDNPGMDFFGALHEEICDLVDWLAPTEAEDHLRTRVWANVTALASKLWPGCQTRPYGSFSTGIYLPTGDLDVCLMKVPGDPATELKKLAILLMQQNTVTGVEAILGARVPIVKYVDTSTDISVPVDISLNQESAISTTQFIRDGMTQLKWLKPLIFVIKLYLAQRGLGETYRGGIGSYLLAVMVTSFLQHHPILRANDTQRRTGLGHLLYGFFKHYGVDFNYHKAGISVRDNGFYFKKADRGWSGERPFLLAAESPLEPDADIGKNSYNIVVVRNAFAQTFQDLTELCARWQCGDFPRDRAIMGCVIIDRDPLFKRKRPPPGSHSSMKRALEDSEASKASPGRDSTPIGMIRPEPVLGDDLLAVATKRLEEPHSVGLEGNWGSNVSDVVSPQPLHSSNNRMNKRRASSNSSSTLKRSKTDA